MGASIVVGVFPMNAMERLLTIEEAAKVLALSRSFTYQLVHEGAFPIVRIGKAIRVRPEDLRSFVDRLIQEQKETDAAEGLTDDSDS
jgi:excisionase family DNA binding protein